MAERLSERAMRFGSLQVKTPPSRSRASLSRVTRPDQRFAPRFEADAFRVVLVRLRVVAMRCFSVETPRLHSRKPLATPGRRVATDRGTSAVLDRLACRARAPHGSRPSRNTEPLEHSP